MNNQVYGYVYMVKNLVNGKIYFGITENDFDARYRSDISKYTHNEHLKDSIKKYGIENFEINKEFDVAHSQDDLWDLEDMYICLYNTLDRKYGYNKRRSGSKHKGCGKLSEEHRQKISDSMKGKGQTLSEEHKQKIIDANKGIPKSKEHRQKISDSMKGKHIGDESPLAKAVICLDTLQVFTTITEASKWCKLKKVHGIGSCCKGKQKSAGKHPITNEKLHWMYYEDYLEQQNEDNSDSNLNVA